MPTVSCKDRPLDAKPLREPHFEGVSLHLRGDSTAESQPHAAVVRTWRDHHGGPAASLLMTRLGIEPQPDQFPARRYISSHYQASRPTALPVETSPCRFRRLTLRRSTFKEYLRTRSGRTRSRPFSTDRSTAAPSSTCASAAKDRGIRNPRLFPHFWIFVCKPLPTDIQ